jgi:hypothetical protein
MSRPNSKLPTKARATLPSGQDGRLAKPIRRFRITDL